MIGWLSQGDAAVLVALIGLFGGAQWVQGRKAAKQLTQINKAVNHVGPDEPTLIQRTRNLETVVAANAAWTAESLHLIARQLGVDLPPKETK